MDCRVEATDGEVFQKDVAVAAATNSHFGEEFKAADRALSACEVEFCDGAGVGFGWFGDEPFAAPRGSKLKRAGAFMSEEGEQGVAKAQLVTVLEQLLFDRLPVDKTIPAAMIVAQHIPGGCE